MQIWAEKEAIMEALTAVAPALSSKSVIPALQGILFTADQGAVTVTTTDLERATRYRMNTVQVKGEGAMVAPGKEIITLIHTLPKGEIGLLFEEQVLTIKYTGGEATLRLMPGEDYPMVPNNIDGPEIDVDTAKLEEAIAAVSYAVDDYRSATRPIFTALVFEGAEDALTLVGCDVHRVAAFTIPMLGIPEFSALIPGKFFTSGTIKNIRAADEIKVTIGAVMAKFENDRMEMMVNLIPGNYVDWRKVFPKEKTKGTITCKPTQLKELLQRARNYSEGKDQTTRIHMEISAKGNKPGSLKVQAKGMMGTFQEEMKDVAHGEHKAIFNAAYILDAIRPVTDELTIQFYGTDNTPAVIEKDEYKALFLPILVS